MGVTGFEARGSRGARYPLPFVMFGSYDVIAKAMQSRAFVVNPDRQRRAGSPFLGNAALASDGAGITVLNPGIPRYGVIAAAGEWFFCLCPGARPRWLDALGAQSSACWFAQVRWFCGQCPWLSVRWAAWMPARTDI